MLIQFFNSFKDCISCSKEFQDGEYKVVHESEKSKGEMKKEHYASFCYECALENRLEEESIFMQRHLTDDLEFVKEF